MTTKTGLTVRCELDTGQYPSGIVVSGAEMAAINIECAEFHGEWNYTISLLTGFIWAIARRMPPAMG